MKLQPLEGREVDAFCEVALKLGADDQLCAKALAVMTTDRPLLLGMSGWPGAGKDVIGETVMANLGPPPLHLYFSAAIRQEANEIIDACREKTWNDAVDAVMETQHVARADAEKAVSIIHEEAQDRDTTAKTRTTAVRKLLQEWGTDVRRRDDDNYWAYKALAPAVEAIARGGNVYVTDVRFNNEVTIARALGFTLVRLDISRETVRTRLKNRDGLDVNDEELTRLLSFPTESSLDDYTGFDLRFTNEGDVESGVGVVEAYMRTKTA
jgi:hypothetical protein